MFFARMDVDAWPGRDRRDLGGGGDRTAGGFFYLGAARPAAPFFSLALMGSSPAVSFFCFVPICAGGDRSTADAYGRGALAPSLQ